MKSRLTLIFAALVVLLGTMIWLVQDRRSLAASVPMTAAVEPVAPVIQVEAAPQPAVASSTVPTTAPAVAAVDESKPLVSVDADGTLKYVARSGDTVSQLAIALLGSDSKAHRDAVIAANDSLQADPDRVLSGKTYSIAAAPVKTTDDASPVVSPVASPVKTQVAINTPAAADVTTEKLPASTDAAPAQKPVAAIDDASTTTESPKLKYTAQPGDTVGVLAANLLGGDTKENRDLIIGSNASLQRDPNHLVAGESYTIVAANGLAVGAGATPMKLESGQPDADDVARVAVGRTLRYTAQPGDTVTKLASVLLGSDTPANRDLIIKANPSLKHDPDHLVAGKTYWIAAPTADAMP